MAAKESSSAGTAATRKALTGQQAAKHLTVVPEMEWAVQWRHGTLRHADGDAARLVRLADVVRYLVRTREMPFKDAVELICRTLENGKGLRLYRVDETGYARALDERSLDSTGWDKFFEVPDGAAERLAYFSKEAAKHLRAAWLMRPHELARLVNHPQLPSDSDYQEEKESPFDYSDRRGDHGARYAVALHTAHELWGWGNVAAGEVVQLRAVQIDAEPDTYQALVAHYKKANRHFVEAGSVQRDYAWTPERKAILAVEKARRVGQRGAAKAMAQELCGMSVSNLNALIRKMDESGKRKARRAA